MYYLKGICEETDGQINEMCYKLSSKKTQSNRHQYRIPHLLTLLLISDSGLHLHFSFYV